MDRAVARTRAEVDITTPFTRALVGNELFERAVDACGADAVVATVLVDTLALIGSSADRLAMVELADILPELERRLRLMVPPEAARRQIARLRGIVLGWED